MSWGGKYQSVQKSALGDSYTQQGGTQINWISWSDNPRLKIQDIIKKDTKNLSVDILDLLIGSRFSLNEIETNCENGALYKFDLKKYFIYKQCFYHINQYFRCKIQNQREKQCRFMGSNLI